MTQTELIKAEIERLKENAGIGLTEYSMGHENGVCDTCDKLLAFINSLPEEPVSKDLEELDLYTRHWFTSFLALHA